MNIDIPDMLSQLRLPQNDPKLISFYGARLKEVLRSAHYGYLEFLEDGFCVVFKEAPWVIPVPNASGDKTLHVSAFQLHRSGHEGYQAFRGHLPDLVEFNDTKELVIEKLGQPTAVGGGGSLSLLNKAIPVWLKFNRNSYAEHYQFDASNQLELVTLLVEDQQQK